MEELYMKQLIGFEDGIDQVCRLGKSIYGRKQAGIIISTAQCWISDIHTCEVFICPYILQDREKIFNYCQMGR